MRILYVVDSSDIGGVATQVTHMMRYLDPDRFEIFIACPAGGRMVEIYERSARRVYAVTVRSFFSLKAIREVISIIDREKIDIIHSKLFTSDFCASLASVIMGKIFISSILGFNFLATKEGFFGRVVKLIEAFTYRAVYIPARRLIAVSKAVRDDLITRPGIKVSADKIEVVYCGVPEMMVGDIEMARSRVLASPGDRIISCVANFFHVKGHYYLLNAMPSVLAKFPKAKLILVGDGPERPALEDEADRLGISKRILFSGYLSEEEKNAVLALSEFVVLPSIMEGCPQVVLEAMALNKAVVATRVGGVPELVRAPQAGLLVNPGNPIELSSAIIRLLSDVNLAKAMGREARSIYERDFSIKKTVRLTADIYFKLLRTARK